MENISLDMSGYFHSLERFLDCPKTTRRPFLDRTRRMIQDFIQSKPDATSQEVANFLGDPRELAQGFLETLDPEMLERYYRRKKLLLRGCIALLAVALVAVSVFGIFFKKTPVNLEMTETIVIYGDLTYKGTTEETS